MGGIILRQIQAITPLPYVGRVVMLGPPNQGSEIVDKMGNMKVFQSVNGPSSFSFRLVPKVYPTVLGQSHSSLGSLLAIDLLI